MILSKFVQGLQIFQKYYDLDGFRVDAEHDEFFVYTTDRPLSEEDLKTVIDLGWFQPEVEPDAAYDPAQGWEAYV